MDKSTKHKLIVKTTLPTTLSKCVYCTEYMVQNTRYVQLVG